MCEDDNGVFVEKKDDDYRYYDYCPTRYSPEQMDIYWFIINSVEVIERSLSNGRKRIRARTTRKDFIEGQEIMRNKIFIGAWKDI